MDKLIFFPKETIEKRIQEIALQIQKDYIGKKFLLLGVLNGAYMFVADLSRVLWEHGCRNFEVDFVGISSYGVGIKSSKKPKLTKDISIDIANRHVLIVEDIIETGFTLQYVYDLLKRRNPLSLKTIVLLSKPEKKQIKRIPEYVGFEVSGNTWVEGYGLDTGGLGRGSPDIFKRNNMD
ncbi:MAG: hypoxanthine phosphoribosyltransferase [Candidatus Levybacteria bacterium RIFCSPHIGHO2_12_FULL_38_12]|nr:MAG: hypoxanthine phosphoribosyltransferase [Candidatus Levybacteria bacterium RIFCSPHIGHO2_01_FULL_38_12]OGH22046.1 MAG: hypoxanthine phosphoribosyltransferase [Candidatus Levybacteria bacterium RIFCSPHIGHO2_02_FULL_37_18]OGH23236.1 MAG: hypoxanthine phosphoribosyltransferase [Candidatus Levybacteria bacterium RIFCSPHIGHO2_12_FULL_38_12]OGH33739.1 MAG: hypoxanthine phosphoribosyltransferase [Candidatus Levybacteria bacterium RIFCSPLOWO2_01_FULL_37_20]OGH44645.1 MAG: hypoxanthine phosphoribo